ncbi:MAG TPA: hypothetical protein VLK22_00095 [Candidatus Udaeobacter sp.]|nr:hypothetical protein [Candidatus Udaeobacter sp.]
MNKNSYFNLFFWLIIGLSLAFYANSTALAATAKTSEAKHIVKPQVQSTAKKTVVTQLKDKTVASPAKNTSVVSTNKPADTCMQAIAKANKECKAISQGCHSFSETPRCKSADQTCADKQQAAMELCGVK